MPDAAAEIRDAAMHAGRQVRLHPTSLTVPRGTIAGIVGRNGSGKSTLLGVLAGELRPSAGHAFINGDPITALGHTELARRRALLAQDTQVSFGFTVGDVVGWGRIAWRGTPEAEDDARIVAEAIAGQELAALIDRPVTSLSGGERKRVHLARVVAQQADLLLLDEADADLDLVGRRGVDDLVLAHARAGGTAVIVSHDVTRLARVCDRLLIMRAGRLHADGPPADVLRSDLLSAAFDARVEVTGSGDQVSIRLP